MVSKLTFKYGTPVKVSIKGAWEYFYFLDIHEEHSICRLIDIRDWDNYQNYSLGLFNIYSVLLEDIEEVNEVERLLFF